MGAAVLTFSPPLVIPRPAPRTHCPRCGALLVPAAGRPIRWTCPNGHKDR